MRLFLAIELTQPVRRHLVQVQDALEPLAGRISWARPQNLHLTLKFLGEVNDAAVSPLCQSLKQIPCPGPLDLAAEQLTCFPPRGPMRIVAVGLHPLPALLTLVERIESACQLHGFPLEGRGYTPHITIARARSPLPASLRPRLEDATRRLFPGPAMAVERFTLMQSQLTRQGAIYTPAAHFAIRSRN